MSNRTDEPEDEIVTPEPVDPRFAFGSDPAAYDEESSKETEAMHASSSGSDEDKKSGDSFVDYTSASERQDTVWNPSTPNIVEKSITAEKDSTADPIIGQTLENYKVVKLIGRGGFGSVFLARDTKLKRDAAIKLMHQGKDPDFIRRFMQEAQVLANLSKHPNIVQIYTWGEWKGEPYFVLEYLDRSADSLLKIHPDGLPLLQALNIGIQASAALAHAHKNGILHRDLKPENILIDDATETVKLCDFGLALLNDPDEDTAVTIVAGSPAFMSPEQVTGKPLDGRTDIFSLGVTLYKLLSGEIPYEGKSQGEIFTQVIQHKGRKLSKIRPDLPKSVVRIVECCMSAEPDKRYADAQLLEADLTRLKNELERSGSIQTKVVSRRKVPRLLTGVAALLVVGALLFGVDRFLALNGDSSKAPIGILAEADMLLAEGHPADAVSLLKRYIEAGNSEDEAHFLLSVAHAQSGDHVRADQEASALKSAELRNHAQLAMVVASPNSKAQIEPLDALTGLAAASQEFRQKQYQEVVNILNDYAPSSLDYAWERARYHQLEALALYQLGDTGAAKQAFADYGNISGQSSPVTRAMLAMTDRQANAERRAAVTEQISNIQSLMDEDPARRDDSDFWSSRPIRIRIENADATNSALAADSGLAGALPELLAGGIEQLDSGRFKIVNRQFIGDVLFEQQISRLSAKGNEARVGRLLGASLLIQAKFQHLFDEDYLGIKLVDTETSEQAQLARIPITSNLDVNTWLDDVIAQIVSRIDEEFPLRGILTVTGAQASINVGSAHGVKAGTQFEVFASAHAPSPLNGVTATVTNFSDLSAEVEVVGASLGAVPKSGWYLRVAQ